MKKMSNSRLSPFNVFRMILSEAGIECSCSFFSILFQYVSNLLLLFRSHPLITLTDNLQRNVSSVPLRGTCTGPNDRKYHWLVLIFLYFSNDLTPFLRCLVFEIRSSEIAKCSLKV